MNSNNSTSHSGSTVGSLYGANYFQSANGGTIWGGSYQGAVEPIVVILLLP
ncbi:MAG: hypothetical protein R2764_07860 [Bacteroidales bacterium]